MTDFSMKLVQTQRLAKIYEQKQVALGELRDSLMHHALSGKLS